MGQARPIAIVTALARMALEERRAVAQPNPGFILEQNQPRRQTQTGAKSVY
jgi:hypothetical protein